MATKRKVFISLSVGGVVVHGPQIPMPVTGDVESVICPHCLTVTKKTVIGEIIQFGIIDDQHYLAICCEKCHNTWTCNFALEHWAYGTIS